MRTSSGSPSFAVAHGGHVIAAAVFMVVSLLAVALVERLRASRAMRRRRPIVLVVVAAGAKSGGIHLAVLPGHWRVAEIYGVFFLLAGTIQLGYSVLLVVRPSRGLLMLNALATLGLLLVWVQSRSVGVPVGPDRGQPEALGVVDGTCALLELVVLLASTHVLRRPHQKVVLA